MLIGGMFDVDLKLLLANVQSKGFSLRCDINNNYTRKIYTNNGRTATVYAFLHGMKLPADAEVLVPEYNCVSIINALESVPIKFSFYKIKKGLIIDTDSLKQTISDKTKVIYIIHYFGIPQPSEVVKEILKIAKEKNLYIVEDLTQTLFSKEDGRIGFGDYLVSSMRKWYPMTDGGIIAAKNNVPFEIVPLKDAYDEAVFTQMYLSLARMYYREGIVEDIDAYIKLEKKANSARYKDFSPRYMTWLSTEILNKSNQEEIIRTRRQNYLYLYEHLKEITGISILENASDKDGKYVPFGFIVIIEDRERFRNWLSKHCIVGEIQWILPTQYYTPSIYAQYMSDHSLMIHCDQRYSEKEMSYIVCVIKEYIDTINKQK